MSQLMRRTVASPEDVNQHRAIESAGIVARCAATVTEPHKRHRPPNHTTTCRRTLNSLNGQGARTNPARDHELKASWESSASTYTNSEFNNKLPAKEKRRRCTSSSERAVPNACQAALPMHRSTKQEALPGSVGPAPILLQMQVSSTPSNTSTCTASRAAVFQARENATSCPYIAPRAAVFQARGNATSCPYMQQRPTTTRTAGNYLR